MKKMTKFLSVIISIMIMITALPLVGIDLFLQVDAKTLSQYEVGDIIEFGSYPQSEVTDSNLISTLNSLSKTWLSYGYYISTGDRYDSDMQTSDFMKYADVTYNGNRYRAIVFTQYRMYCVGYFEGSDGTYQDNNGYSIDTVYWFKYEPIQWRVLDPNEGFVMCESIIDSQAYNNSIYSNGSEYYQNNDCEKFANDYATSSIRDWLNDDFYNTAFNETEKAEIQYSEQDNRCCNSNYLQYDSDTTSDRIFLLSYDEVISSVYSFSSKPSDDDVSRQARGTDYAKAQGLFVYKSLETTYDSYNEISQWWLRSPMHTSKGACGVSYDGSSNGGFTVDSASIGVRPALKFNPKTKIDNFNGTDSEDVKNNDKNKNTTKNNSADTPIIAIIIAVVAISVVVSAGIIVIIIKKRK